MNKEAIFRELTNDLDFIGGRIMEKPANGGITFSEIKEDKDVHGLLKRIKNVLLDAEGELLKLENQNTLLAKEIVRIRKRDAQIAELMGLKK